MLSGKGGVFTAGNDLGDFVAAASRESGDFPAWRFTTRLAEFGKPLVAAVDGLAVGIGTTLLFHCDLVYATPESRFQTPFVNLGLVPEAGSSLLAPQRFGRAKAAELLLLAEPFDAGQAHALGLVNALVPRADLIAHAMGKAAALAAKPRAALLATRRLMRGDGEALESAHGRGDARLRRSAQVRRGAQGFPGLPVGRAEVAGLEHPARRGRWARPNFRDVTSSFRGTTRRLHGRRAIKAPKTRVE